MRLVITADIDVEESGLDPDEVKDNIVEFTRDLLVIGAGEQEIGLTLKEVEYIDSTCENVSWKMPQEGERITRATYEHLCNLLRELKEYKDAGAAPGQIREFSSLYLEKCQEVNKLQERIGRLERQEGQAPSDMGKQMDNDWISRKEVLDIIRPRLNSAKEGTLEKQRLYSIFISVQEMPAAHDANKVLEQLADAKMPGTGQLL